MTMNRTVCTMMTLAGWLVGSGLALAQNSPTPPAHVPLEKTIGQAKPEVVPSLIVMNARGANLQGGKLTLTGVAPSAIVFADRPVRAAGHVPTANLLEEWGSGSESFAADPPNATVSVFGKDGAVRDAVIVLKTPTLEGDRLTFDVDVLEGDVTGGDGPAGVFIDRFGFGGFHAGGFGGFHAGGVGGFRAAGFRGGFDRVGAVGGVDRVGAVGVGRVGTVGVDRVGAVGVGRVGYVGVGGAAWYRGAPVAAAAVGGAALGAAAAANAYRYPYPYAPPACGYYPYPPCY